MIYKRYGKTDEMVSAVGFGGMRFDANDVANNNLSKCADVVLYAHSKGINYFDTAPMYCEDKSEEIMGIGLSQLKRDSYYISSKVNFSTITGEPTRDNFRKRLELSLERLKVNYIDFYHMWCMLNIQSFNKHTELLYKFFEEAKSEGLIKHITFSSHMSGPDLAKVIDRKLFEGVLLGYNALNYRFRSEGVISAYNNGLGVVVMNPLCGGIIPENKDKFNYLSQGTHFTATQGAIRFVASQREVSVALVGINNNNEIDEAVAAVENLEILPATEVFKKMPSNTISLENLCTGCGYCNSCPMDIPIVKFMDSYNSKIFGEGILHRLKWQWGITNDAAKKCTGCKKCEKLCTQHLPISERMIEISKL